MKGDRELYRVFLPFTSATGYKLAPPVELPGVAISADGSEYRAEIVVTATSGEDALARARLILADVFGTFAVQRAGFAEVQNPRRLVQLVDPEPVLEGPIPPFDVVGGGITLHGAETFDPSGDMRRARRIVNVHAEGTATKNNLDKERGWLTVRDTWSAELRRAIALIHASEVAGDADVAFVLAFSAIEVLAAPPVGLLPSKIPDPSDRDRLLGSVRGLLTAQPNLSETDVDRLANNLSATHVESPIARFLLAFDEVGIEIEETELKWLRDQRGAYLHSGGFDNSQEAVERRNAFRSTVAARTAGRLDTLAQRGVIERPER
jgi:hypothetical protein